jgi:hypothetical protein
MTTRRRLLVFGLLAGVFALGAGGWLLWPTEPRTAITRENAEKLKTGMTLEEVQAILDGPARNDATVPVALEFQIMGPRLSSVPRHLEIEPLIWQSNVVQINAWFDVEHKLISFNIFTCRRVPESPLDMLRRWLHL